MRKLVHLSDLHFGRIDESLLAPLQSALAEIRPHLVVVSGDLTQRARPWQFREARRFLDQLPAPNLAVPGNHDVPLYDVFTRFVRPLHRYRRHISDDVEPLYIDDEIAVAGVNTARSMTIQGGRINRAQIDRLRRRLAGVDADAIRIAVTHHPFDAPAGHEARKLVGRAAMAMRAMAEARVDVCLSGHLHVAHVAHAATRYLIPGRRVLLVQAGTATSTRGRGEVNSFNVLHIDRPALRIERHAWDPGAGMFAAVAREDFERRRDGWHPVAAH